MKPLTNNEKKLAAAMAAVSMVIKTEEEAMYAMSIADAAKPQTSAVPSYWGLSGRQAMMQNRNLMQLRTFHGTTPR